MGLQALLFNAPSPQSVDEVIPLVLRYRVKGVIITTAALSSKAADQCMKREVPVVLFNRYTRNKGVTSVACDNADGGRMAAEVLLRAGARKLAFLGGLAESSTSKDRQRGFTARLKVEKNARLVAVLGKEFTYEWGWEGTLRLFEMYPEIDGIFCADDEIASGALDALRFNLKKLVPEQVQVIGFDDHPIAAKASYKLTTIRQPVDRMIKTAIDALLSTDKVRPSNITIKGELICRNSVRLPRNASS